MMGFSLVYEPAVDGVWSAGIPQATDDKGRFIGHLAGVTDDDEEIYPNDDRFANEDNLWNQVASGDYSGVTADGNEPDYSGGYVSRHTFLSEEEQVLAEAFGLDGYDTPRAEVTRRWCKKKYAAYFEIDSEAALFGRDFIDEIDDDAALFAYDFLDELEEEFFGADESVGSTFQSGSSALRESSAAVLNRPVGYDSTWHSAGDLRLFNGRSHHSDKRIWWAALAKQRRKNRERFQAAATNRFALYGSDWFSELIMEDIEDGQAVIENENYYERLLAVNDIDRELKNEWADWAEFQTFAQTAETELRETLLRLNDPVTPNHGWGYLELSARGQREFLNREWEEELERERQEFRGFGGYDGYDDSYYMYPDNHYDDIGNEREQDDRYYQAMVDAELGDWDDIDESRIADELAAELDAATITQHGGPRGWKASKVARLCQAEYA